MTLTTFIMPEYDALCINSWCSKSIERSASIQSIDTVDKTGEWSNQTQISLTLSMKRLKQLSRSSNEQIERWADRAMRNRAMSRSSGNREGVPKSGSSNQKQSFIQKIKCIQVNPDTPGAGHILKESLHAETEKCLTSTNFLSSRENFRWPSF